MCPPARNKLRVRKLNLDMKGFKRTAFVEKNAKSYRLQITYNETCTDIDRLEKIIARIIRKENIDADDAVGGISASRPSAASGPSMAGEPRISRSGVRPAARTWSRPRPTDTKTADPGAMPIKVAAR